MPQIILKERTAHLVSYTSFTRDVDQNQKRQPPLTLFSQKTYYLLLTALKTA